MTLIMNFDNKIEPQVPMFSKDQTPLFSAPMNPQFSFQDQFEP